MDWTLFHTVNTVARHTPWAHAPARAYAKYGIALFAALLLAGVLLAGRRGARALARATWTACAALIALAINQPIGQAIGRARPYATHPHVLVLVARSTDAALPSDHAVVAGAVAAGLLAVSWRLGLVALSAAALMAFARVYVGAAYPGDVAAGLAFGALVTLFGLPLADRFLTPLAERFLAGPLGRVLTREARPPAA